MASPNNSQPSSASAGVKFIAGSKRKTFPCVQLISSRRSMQACTIGAPGTRKLQDVLVDMRVPARERARVPLVTCDGRVVWVGGLLLAEEGRITERTTALVRLSVERRLGQGGDGEPAGEGKGGRG